MNNSTILRQLLEIVPRYKFNEIVNKYEGDKWVQKFTCWAQFVTMTFAQLKQRDSLRHITTGLSVHLKKLYHLGLPEVKKSTLAEANSKRDWRIYQELFYYLLNRCNQLTKDHLNFPKEVFILDATLIQLCHSLFDWAKYRKTKGAVKMHTLLNLETYLPEFVLITDGKVGDITAARDIPIQPDSILLIDRAYIDYEWLYSLHCDNVTFVTRAKSDMSYETIGQHDVPENSDVLADEDIIVPWRAARRPDKYAKYPDYLRLVTVVDPETGEVIRFLTNNTEYSAQTIALLYRKRWEVEIFFKFIKQNLKIKSFVGTSQNAVFVQIWIALILYLLVWFLKKQTGFSNILKLFRLLNEAAFERISMIDILSLDSIKEAIPPPCLQLNLF